MRPPDATVRRRADADRNRAHILDTAAEVLRADPAAPFEQVIAATGLARTTVYRHFPTRDELVEEVVARGLRAAHAVLERARPRDAPFAEALDRMTLAALTAGSDVWGLLGATSGERLAGSPAAAGIDAAVTAMMELGTAENALRDDVPLAWLVDVYFAVLGAAVRDGRTDPGRAGTVIDVFLRGAEST